MVEASANNNSASVNSVNVRTASSPGLIGSRPKPIRTQHHADDHKHHRHGDGPTSEQDADPAIHRQQDRKDRQTRFETHDFFSFIIYGLNVNR